MMASNMLAVDRVWGPLRQLANPLRHRALRELLRGRSKAFEFVIEFGDGYPPNSARAHAHRHQPVYALELLDVMESAVRRYESRYGPVTARRSTRTARARPARCQKENPTLQSIRSTERCVLRAAAVRLDGERNAGAGRDRRGGYAVNRSYGCGS